MRTTAAWVATVLFAMGATSLFWWQHDQIVGYRAQLAAQSEDPATRADPAAESGQSWVMPASYAPQGATGGIRKAAFSPSGPRGDERNLILDQYRDVVAQLNLPADTASRLQNLLAERVEAVLAAEDRARREGYAEASAVAQQAVAMAIAQEDQRIIQLIGLANERRLDGSTPAGPEAVPAPVPAAPVVVVNVPAPAPAYDYSAVASAPADTGSYAAYPSYPYLSTYPYAYYSTVGYGYSSYGRGGRPYAYPTAPRRYAPTRSAVGATYAAHSALSAVRRR